MAGGGREGSGEVDSAVSNSPPPVRPARWGARISAIVAAALFVWGALLLTDWLNERKDAGRPIAAPRTGARSLVIPEAQVDPRALAYRSKRVEFSPVRAERVGADQALFFAGPSPDGPAVVFGEILRRTEQGITEKVAHEILAMGPSAQVALRLQHTVGRMPGGAFLLRLPPDIAAAKSGRSKLEPGAVMLAYDCGSFWEYVCFFFPQGLDLDALLKAHAAPPPRVLLPLGERASRYLEPTLDLGGGRGGLRTVLCRAKGETGTAVDRCLEEMERAGWRRVHRGDEAAHESIYVLQRPEGEVWIHAANRSVTGGVVTVMIATFS